MANIEVSVQSPEASQPLQPQRSPYYSNHSRILVPCMLRQQNVESKHELSVKFISTYLKNSSVIYLRPISDCSSLDMISLWRTCQPRPVNFHPSRKLFRSPGINHQPPISNVSRELSRGVARLTTRLAICIRIKYKKLYFRRDEYFPPSADENVSSC